ncbi:MAG: serine/threonine protein kinase [Nannocystaceae bacterium]|nr:serine/threonine protein kinase [Nannocystaceae bacterium]
MPSSENCCPSDEDLVAYVGGNETRALDDHIAQCGRCHEVLRLFAAVTASSSESVEPGRPEVPLRYQLQSSLGQGGQGVVWRAYDTWLGRDVALKVVRCANEEHRARLMAEARALAALEHPHILEVYDLGLQHDPGFIAMPVCQGSLAEEINAEQGWKSAVAAMRAVALGLAVIHEAGYVHGDVKPTNLLRDAVGVVKVADFGLATAPESARTSMPDVGKESPELRSMTGFGTMAYFAPELRLGRPHSPATDQYAFFVSLAQLLSGVLPRANGNWEPPGFVPRWLRSVIKTGLSPDPADRFASLDAVVRALDEPRSSRTWALWALGAAAAVAVTVSSFTPDPAGAQGQDVASEVVFPVCDGPMPQVWSLAMEASILKSEHPSATEHVQRLARSMDTFSVEYRSAHFKFCGAQRHEARACLDAVREPLDAMTRRLATGSVTASGVSTLVRKMPELVSFEHCHRVGERVGVQPQPDRRARAAAADLVFGAVADQVLGQDPHPSADVLTEALEAGRLDEFPDLRAAALRHLASQQLMHGTHPTAGLYEDLTTAEGLAMLADAPRIQAAVWMERTNLSIFEADLVSAGSHLAFADAATKRAGSPVPDAMRVALLRAMYLAESEDFEGALASAVEASELAQGIGAVAFRGRADSARVAALDGLGRFDEAIAAARGAVASSSEGYGLEHPVTDQAHLALGTVLVASGRAREAMTGLIALADRLSHTRPDSQALGSVLIGLGNAANQISDPQGRAGELPEAATARDAFQDALVIYAKLEAAWGQGLAEAGLGQLALRQRRFSDAEGHYVRALFLLEQDMNHNDPELVLAREELRQARQHEG